MSLLKAPSPLSRAVRHIKPEFMENWESRRKKNCCNFSEKLPKPWLALAVLGFGLFTINVIAAESAEPADRHQNDEWVQTHFLNSPARLPFSFVYGTQSSNVLLKDWVKNTQSQAPDGDRTEHSLTWKDPRTQLRVRLTAV